MLQKCLMFFFFFNNNILPLQKNLDILAERLNALASMLTNETEKISFGIKLPGGVLQAPPDSIVDITSSSMIIIEIPSPGGILKVPYNTTVQLPDGSIIKAPASGNVRISTGGIVKVIP